VKICIGILLVFVAGMFVAPPFDGLELVSILIFALGTWLIFWGMSEEDER